MVFVYKIEFREILNVFPLFFACKLFFFLFYPFLPHKIRNRFFVHNKQNITLFFCIFLFMKTSPPIKNTFFNERIFTFSLFRCCFFTPLFLTLFFFMASIGNLNKRKTMPFQTWFHELFYIILLLEP